jgi:hypothetical protein
MAIIAIILHVKGLYGDGDFSPEKGTFLSGFLYPLQKGKLFLNL